VFVLEVDPDTMNRRIDERVALDPTDFGRKPEERELAVRLHQTKEDIPKKGIIIDATAPLARVVDKILRLSDANKPPASAASQCSRRVGQRTVTAPRRQWR
jgi:thymidylate kinase